MPLLTSSKPIFRLTLVWLTGCLNDCEHVICHLNILGLFSVQVSSALCLHVFVLCFQELTEETLGSPIPEPRQRSRLFRSHSESSDELSELDLSHGKKDAFVLEVPIFSLCSFLFLFFPKDHFEISNCFLSLWPDWRHWCCGWHPVASHGHTSSHRFVSSKYCPGNTDSNLFNNDIVYSRLLQL